VEVKPDIGELVTSLTAIKDGTADELAKLKSVGTALTGLIEAYQAESAELESIQIQYGRLLAIQEEIADRYSDLNDLAVRMVETDHQLARLKSSYLATHP
jgi:hypothetical protein